MSAAITAYPSVPAESKGGSAHGASPVPRAGSLAIPAARRRGTPGHGHGPGPRPGARRRCARAYPTLSSARPRHPWPDCTALSSSIVMSRTITAGFPLPGQWCMIASVADSKSDLRARIRAARSKAASAADSGAGTRRGCSRPREPLGCSIRTGARTRWGRWRSPRTSPLPASRTWPPYGPPSERRAAWSCCRSRVPTGPSTGPSTTGTTGPRGGTRSRFRPARSSDRAPRDCSHTGFGRSWCPALAVDATGARLGQGGGYYDRLLSGLATLVGPSREEVDRLPIARRPRAYASWRSCATRSCCPREPCRGRLTIS